MVRHTDDNDKKPRPRQDGARSRPRKDGPRDASPRAGDRPQGKFAKDGKPGAKGGAEPSAPLRQERIAKVMARAGVSSRREVERLIGLGKVAVNGRILDTAATLVTRDDKITVNGKPMAAAQATRVWRYHKPVGLLTSHNDPAGRPTVFDALPNSLPRVISVGRLDMNSEGLLLLTNDGELARALEMPTTAWVRQYRARARGRVTQETLDKLQEGAFVDGVRYGPMQATLEKAKEGANDGERGGANLWISVAITEGKNREVRKVLESIGLTVNRLIRLAYGPFQLGTLERGAVEEVGPRVIRELLSEHIRPENLPTGNTVQTPVPTPGRRGGGAIIKGNSGSAMSDPSRKPSRTRAAEAATIEGVARSERGPKKEGWAKVQSRAAGIADRPRRTFKPRDGEEGDKAKRPWVTGPDERPRSGGFKPRTEGAGNDRPRTGGFKSDGFKSGGFKSGGAGKPGGRPSGAEGRFAGKPSGGARPSGTSGRAPGAGRPGGKPGGGRPR
jgi:23S rRNA pseudouridine2605 synthase